MPSRNLSINTRYYVVIRRYMQTSGTPLCDPEKELAIHITLDAEKKLFIIEDSGIGLLCVKRVSP